MANKNAKWSENATGRFYVDQQCIDCDLCRETAPAFFTRNDEVGFSYVSKQPVTEKEMALCQEALEGCPVDAIGSDGVGDAESITNTSEKSRPAPPPPLSNTTANTFSNTEDDADNEDEDGDEDPTYDFKCPHCQTQLIDSEGEVITCKHVVMIWDDQGGESYRHSKVKKLKFVEDEDAAEYIDMSDSSDKRLEDLLGKAMGKPGTRDVVESGLNQNLTTTPIYHVFTAPSK